MHSGIVLARADTRPIYIQIIEQIRQRIAVGDWAPGFELPSIRELAGELRVSVITVKRAYLELERDGVIVTRHGKGSTVADQPALSSRLLEEELAEQLEQVARRALLLDLAPEELGRRLDQAMRRMISEVS